MNHLEKVAAAQYIIQPGLTKEAWDRNAWYSYVPIVGDIGNAVSNASDGNWLNAAGNLGMAALNFIPGAGLAAKGLQLGAKGLGSMAAKGIAAKGMTAGGQRLATQAAGGITSGINKAVARTGTGRLNSVVGSMAKSPKTWLAGSAVGSILGDTLGGDDQQQQPQQQSGGLGLGWNQNSGNQGTGQQFFNPGQTYGGLNNSAGSNTIY
jgi:hypothetical protein